MAILTTLTENIQGLICPFQITFWSLSTCILIQMKSHVISASAKAWPQSASSLRMNDILCTLQGWETVILQSKCTYQVRKPYGSGPSFPPFSLVIPKHIWEGNRKVEILSWLACVAQASIGPQRCSTSSHGGGECLKPTSSSAGDSVKNSVLTPCKTFVRWVQRVIPQSLGTCGLMLFLMSLHSLLF